MKPPLFLGLLIFWSGAVVAEQSKPPADATKRELIKIMQGVHFVPQLGADEPLCKTFYEDFKQQKNIEHIQPIVKADVYDDPALRPYQEKCPALKMHKTMTFEPRDIEVAGEPEDEEDAEARAIGVYYGMGNFQLYRVDINNDPKDGDELLLYYEGEYDRKHNKAYPAHRLYRQLNLTTCEAGTAVHFNVLGSPKWTRNGVIRYKGMNAIYTLESWKEQQDYLYLKLEIYSNELKRLATFCTYHKPR